MGGRLGRKTGSGSGVQRPSLQTWLLALILLVLIPTLGVVAMTLLRAGQSYREASTNQLLETAHVVAQSVESELQAKSHLLASYVPSPLTVSSDVDANALFEGRLGSMRLATAPSGPSVDTDGVLGDLARRASAGQMAVSNIFMTDVDGQATPSIAIAVPHITGKADVDVTTLITKPAALIQTLMRQGAFADALVLAVTDGAGRVIARSRDADRFIGKPVPDWRTLVTLRRPNGTFEARTIEGSQVIFAFQTIRGTPGWVAVVGEPLKVFNSRWRQPITVLLIASVATIFFAFNFAMLLARRILRPIKLLAQHASAVAEGRAVERTISIAASPSFVAEFETLRQSLESAEVETRRSHQALRQSYQSQREAEKLARIGNWTLDLASGRVTYSDMLYELNGTVPAGAALTVADLPKVLSPGDSERVSAAIATCSETGEPYGMEVEYLRADGTRFAAYMRGQAKRDEAGRIIGLTGTVQDISERREERERLAALADNLPSGAIYRLETCPDDGFEFTYISAGIARLIGVSAAEIVAHHAIFLDIIHPEDRAGYLAAKEQSRRDLSPIDHEFRMNTRDGRAIWMQCRSAVRRQSDGRVVWDGIARDITGERNAAESLRQAKEAAEIAERAKSDFLATMSHEIRTPMNTVIGMTRLTLQTDLAPKQRNYLEKIDVSAKVLLGIINDVLDFSKIEAGALELEDTVFTLESLLESVSAIMAMPAEEKGLEIAYAVAAEAPVRLRGDPLRLGQVLTNLVGNAVKFTEHGEVVISIEPSTAENGSPLLQFAVRDTGVGLSAEQIRGLFQPFAQAAHDTARKHGGTGLGLAICKRLVERMGGRIWIESEPGKGSAFFFTVACKPVYVEESSDVSVHRSARLECRRVLIVDDNASARQILCDMVREFGLGVQTAESGERGLAVLRAEAERGMPFDMVLMDWRMPTMDGLETARKIRADKQLLHMPAVLMVTAYGREEVLFGAQQLGLEGVLIKPITKSVMFNTIMEILSPSSSLRLQRSTILRQGPTAGDPLYARLVGKRVLVVDDHSLNREVASDFLRIVGVTVDTAVNGVDALDKLELHDFDAVLMDMHMPVMDGLTAVREIRRRQRCLKLPVIALTAQARLEDQQTGLEAGMTAHLTKPINEALLYRTLIDVLGLDIGDGPRRTVEGAAKAGAEEMPGIFSLSAARRRFGRDSGRVEMLLSGFLRDFADAPDRLDRHLRTRDVAAVAELAHAMKGSAGYFGAQDFCAAADRLEQAALGQPERIEIESGEFSQQLKRLLDDIRAGLAELHKPDEHLTPAFNRNAVLALIARAVPLLERGDYAGVSLLAEIRGGLKGHGDQDLANDAQMHFDELELEAATAALHRLKETLQAACGSEAS